MNKAMLKSKMEKALFRLVTDEIKEHVVDFTVLYVRRNNLNVDRDSMAKVLDVIRLAIDDAFFKNVDSTMNALDADLEEFIKEVNPLELTVAKKRGRPKKTGTVASTTSRT